MPYFLGIDGGGSKTRCLLGDARTALGRGSSSGCNIVRVGEACAQDSLTSAVHEACVQAGISPREISRTCLGAAGGVRPEIVAALRRIMTQVVGGIIDITGDMQIAFEDAFGPGAGIIVIAGTGSIAYGRNSQGKTARVGGWGFAVSDEGSGHWVGVEAVRAALHARDRGDTQGLLADLMQGLGVQTFEDFIVRVNGDPAPDFSAFFPIVLTAAEAGDTVARDILNRTGHELANLAGNIAQQLFKSEKELSVATHGGVFASSTEVRRTFAQVLKSHCPAATHLAQAIDPARGALQLARSATPKP